MQRRNFITLLGGAVLAAPRAARAQPPRKIPRVGVLNVTHTQSDDGLVRGLQGLGYVDGQNIAIISRQADGQLERLPELAAELLRLKVDIVASGTTQAIQAVRRLSPTIPIVMTSISDPIGSGLVASLARPGGYTTGVTLLSSDLSGKRLELLKKLIPGLTRVAILANPGHPATALLVSESQDAAEVLGLRLRLFEVVGPAEFDETFATMAREKADAVVVQRSTLFLPHLPRIAALAIKHRLPGVHESRLFVSAGGLISYGANSLEQGQRAAAFVDKILKGAHPADLPVEQPVRFELAINLKTARAIGLDVPPTLLAVADEVIE
jgi:putative tryptophan/tyrosine transport system substrate-binding protein